MSEASWLELLTTLLDHRLIITLAVCTLGFTFGVLALIRVPKKEVLDTLREIKKFLGCP